jgi:DNA polymerase-3 subunit beta
MNNLNFEIKKEAFLIYLLQIQKILPQKTFCPIYYSIKIQTDKNVLLLEVSNLNIAIRIKIEDQSLKIKQEGFVIISGKYFIDIMKKIDCDIVEIASIEKKFLFIKTDSSEYKLKITNLYDFPFIDFSFDFENFFEIEINLFKKMIKEINVTTDKNKEKYNDIILTGVNLIYKKPFLKAFSSDSFRLGQKKIKLDLNYPDFNIVLPNKSLEELNKLLDFEKEKFLKFATSNQKFFLYTNSLIFQTSLLEGNYPKLQKIEEKSFLYFFKLNKEKLVKIIERVSLFLPKEGDIIHNIIEFKIDSYRKIIEISSNSEEIGQALEKINILDCFLKEDIKIKTGFNIKYLEEIVKNFPAKEINFLFQNEFNSFIINSEEENTLLYLILPFLIN